MQVQDVVKKVITTGEKVLHTSVGFVSVASERMQKVKDELVERSKDSEKEGEKIVTDFWKKAEQRKEDWTGKVKEATENVVSKVEFPNKKDFMSIADRLESLETKLGLEDIEVNVKKVSTKVKSNGRKATRKVKEVVVK